MLFLWNESTKNITLDILGEKFDNFNVICSKQYHLCCYGVAGLTGLHAGGEPT